jgi:amino acid transporter
MEKQKDLVKGLGLLGLVASCFNCTVGGGIFRLPTSVYAVAGRASPVVYLLCFIVILFVAGVFIQVGRSIRVSGGPYAYVKPVLGEFPGYLCGVLLWVLATFAFASVANAYAHFAAILITPDPSWALESGILISSLALLGWFNARGVKSGAGVSTVLALVKLIPLLVLILAGASHIRSDAVSLPSKLDFGSISRGAMILIFAFTGVESALIPSGEIRDPEKNLPRALILSLSLVLILYLSVQLVAQSVLGVELSIQGVPPLALSAERILGAPGKWILGVGAVLSTLGYLSSMTLSLPRSLFAFSEDGYLPKALSTLSPKTHAPLNAIVAQIGMVCVLAVTSQFEKLAVLANLSAILMYLLCAWAAVVLLKKSRGGISGYLVPTGATLTMGFLLTSVRVEEWASVTGLLLLAGVFYLFKQRSHRVS